MEDRPSHEYNLTQLTLDVSYDLSDNWDFNSITGYVNIDNFYFGNVAERSLDPSQLLGFYQGVNVEQFSQEVRFYGDFWSFANNSWRVLRRS